MLKYELFGQSIAFEDSAERYFDLRSASDHACLEASKRFSTWYKQSGNIQTALDNYLPFVDSVIEELAFRPLFDQLTACEIYDMSEGSYCKRCVHLEHAETSLSTVEQQYNAILKRQNAEKEYRANRKAGRSRWGTVGVGMSGALKGAAQAATLNAATGLGHSVFNALGNAGSAISASMDKNALYKNTATQDALLHGIFADLCSIYSAHIDFVNECKKDYIRSVFDEDRSSALFENAKKLPEKRNQLLVQAFTLCPWNAELVKYIFVHFPDERDEIYTAAQRFSVDLRDSIEDILAQEYDEAAQASEPAAQAAKKIILHYMRKYNVEGSPTLDKLETDCLHRLCKGYLTADEASCDRLIDEVRQYDAQEKLKAPFFKQLEQRITEIWLAELGAICQGLDTADEAACAHRRDEIGHHKAPKDLKIPFFDQIDQRVTEIWLEELEAICQGLDGADESSCEQRKAAIDQHKAPDNLKAPFSQKIQKRIRTIWERELSKICANLASADETACETMLAEIKDHKAPAELKALFMKKVQSRIEGIWSAEDGEIFDNLYMKTDITDSAAVTEAITYVQTKGRTASSQKYLDALNACSPKNIENAYLYHHTNRFKTYMILAILCIIPIITLPLTVIFFIRALNMKKAWKLLTINGAMIHPALLSSTSYAKTK